MSKCIWPFCLVILSFTRSAGQSVPAADSGTYLLHKFAQNIGTEKYILRKQNNELRYSIDFKFVDRGTAVPLKAILKLDPGLQPISLETSGQSSRFSVCNDTVVIQDHQAQIRTGDTSFVRKAVGPGFPVAGYSPGTVQMMLIRYWQKNHRPVKIPLFPAGEVEIKMDGLDTFRVHEKNMVLERYIVSGLIWGYELLWMDPSGQLICLITNDAEGDKLEMLWEPLESLLPDFISKAAASSMRLFRAQSQKLATHPQSIAIVDGTLLDVVNKKEVPHAMVLVENGIIKSVGEYRKNAVPKGAYIIDAAGKTILPGLWDMHAHFEQAEWGPAYLAAGVTTVRDCGNEFEYINAVKNAIDEGSGIGPHIIKAGIIDGTGPRSLGVNKADSRESAVAAVQRYKNNGFEQIKIYSSVKPEVVKAICDEAHRLGLTVTGHIPIGMDIVAGVDSGMDMVNHIDYVYRALKKDGKGQDIDFSDSTNRQLLAFLEKKHVVIDPTLTVYEMILRSLKDSITIIEPSFSSFPIPLQTMLSSTGMPPDKAIAMKPVFEMVKKTVKVLYDQGIPVVAGTDMGFPGFSVYRELELYVQAGIPPADALQCASIIPARVMKKDARYGSIETGKNADILILDGNPFRDIRQLRTLRLVIKDGTIYQPQPLHRMVGFSR